MKNNSRKWYDAPFVFILCAMLLAISFLAGETAARYLSGTQGSDNAQLAVFAVDASAVTAENLEINLETNNSTATYQFEVTNAKNGKVTKVDVAYSIQVTLSRRLPAGLTMALDGLSGTASGDGLTYTFTSPLWRFSAGSAGSITHNLVFTAQSASLTRDDSIPAIQVSVTAEQTD